MTKSTPVLVKSRHSPASVPDVAPYAVASQTRVRSIPCIVSSRLTKPNFGSSKRNEGGRGFVARSGETAGGGTACFGRRGCRSPETGCAVDRPASAGGMLHRRFLTALLTARGVFGVPGGRCRFSRRLLRRHSARWATKRVRRRPRARKRRKRRKAGRVYRAVRRGRERVGSGTTASGSQPCSACDV